MDKLYKLKDAVVDYLSPPAKRRRTLGPETPDASFTANFTRGVASDPQVAIPRASRYARPGQNSGSPSMYKLNPRKRARESYESSSSTDSLVSRGADELGPEDSGSVVFPFGNPDGDDDAPKNQEPKMSAEEKVKEFLARQAEHTSKQEAIKDVKAKGDWAYGEILLFEKISLRSFEPLLPASWKIDYPTIPDNMFTNRKDAFFSASLGDETHAYRKLHQLITNVTNVSSMSTYSGRSPEQIITTSIKNYIRWSEKDGQYNHLRFIPIIAIVQALLGQTMDQLSKKTTDQMAFLAIKHREILALPPPGRFNALGEVEVFARPPPVVYGILVAQRNVILFTMNSADIKASPKYIANFALNDPKMGFWNAVAIGIVVVLARNYMVSIKDELEIDAPMHD